MTSGLRTASLVLLVVFTACSSDTGRDAAANSFTVTDGGALPWDQGGGDIPEYSLARLLVRDAKAPRLTIVDLDSSKIAGEIELQGVGAVHPGATGRYSYAWSAEQRAVRILDPGQWLLSHIDHFHVQESEVRLFEERLEVVSLSFLSAFEGWVTAFDAHSGTATFAQERGLSAMRFEPRRVVTGAAHQGVALVTHAHLVSSARMAGRPEPVLTVRPLDAVAQVRTVAACSRPVDFAARDGVVYVACQEGLWALTWNEGQSTFDAALLVPAGQGAPALVGLAGSEQLPGVIVQRGGRELMYAGGGAAPRAVTFDADVLKVSVRRQASAVIVLTAEGVLHELLLPELERGRSVHVMRPWAGEGEPRPTLALSHAYAYAADPRSPQVAVVRLRTMALEPALEVGGSPADLAVVGMPFHYTDFRE